MARDFYINGESMVFAKGNVASTIANTQQLGLSDGPIRVTPNVRHRDINVDAWGPDIPADIQVFLADVNISMALVHFDWPFLMECLRLSMAGPNQIGNAQRAGTRLGNNQSRFAPTWNYVSLGIASPVAGRPYRFLSAYMTGPPLEFPLGTERSVVIVNWRCIPYTTDPWQGGAGATNYPIWDYTLDD